MKVVLVLTLSVFLFFIKVNLYADGNIIDVVNARNLNIVDKKGNARIRMSVKENNEPEIVMHNNSSNAYISITFNDDGEPSISLYDNIGVHKKNAYVSMAFYKDKPIISLANTNDSMITFTFGDKSPALVLSNDEEKRSFIGLNFEDGHLPRISMLENGKCVLSIGSGSDGGSINLYDKEGKVIEKYPFDNKKKYLTK